MTCQVKNTKTKESLYKILVVYLGKDEELNKYIFTLENKDDYSFKRIKKAILKRLQILGY